MNNNTFKNKLILLMVPALFGLGLITRAGPEALQRGEYVSAMIFFVLGLACIGFFGWWHHRFDQREKAIKADKSLTDEQRQQALDKLFERETTMTPGSSTQDASSKFKGCYGGTMSG